MAWAILIFSLLLFTLGVIYALVTLFLIGLSLYEALHRNIVLGEVYSPLPNRPLRPAITLIAPAYNEEAVIVPSVRSLLASDYDPLEVLVIDDGSTDGTTERLIEAFDLVPLPVGDRFQLETQPVERNYISRVDPRLRVVQKEHGGRSDALNVGLNLARNDLVAMVDSDSLLDRDALARIVEVFSSDPDRVIAVGGTIRIVNGAVIQNGKLVEVRVPWRGTQATQVAEYFRAFFATRIAWASMNGLLIISGAFGVFRRDVLRAVGGLSKATLGEDMEVVMRIHAQLRPGRPDAKVLFAPDATCWTEAPVSLGSLRGQRIRWHIGLLDNIGLHRKMIGRRRFGAVGLFALPYTILFEVLAPLLLIPSYVSLAVLLATDQIGWAFAVGLAIVLLLAAQLQTTGALLIEDVAFSRSRARDVLTVACWSLVEIFWYRPLTALWRTWATFLFLVKRRPGWGTIPRGVALAEAPTDVASAPLSR